MHINKIKLINFKCFKGEFVLELKEGVNILVGNNETGKSTILEAINLGLTGFFHGKALKNELTQYIFNIDVVDEFLKNMEKGTYVPLPDVLIELYFEGENLSKLDGSYNSERIHGCGVSLKIAFDEDKYNTEYNELINSGEKLKTLPIEYYDVFWTSFAWESITSRSIPVKAAMIDSSNMRYQNGSDIYISRIIRDSLEHCDVISISQAHRKMLEDFMENKTIQGVNKKIKVLMLIEWVNYYSLG